MFLLWFYCRQIGRMDFSRNLNRALSILDLENTEINLIKWLLFLYIKLSKH